MEGVEVMRTQADEKMKPAKRMNNAPSKTERLGSLLEGPTNAADNYGSCMSGGWSRSLLANMDLGLPRMTMEFFG